MVFLSPRSPYRLLWDALHWKEKEIKISRDQQENVGNANTFRLMQVVYYIISQETLSFYSND